jgi:5-deoxy-glucuronate isomerase
MTHNEWFHARGSLAHGPWQTVVDDSLSGWQHTGLRVAELGESDSVELPAGGVERLIVPLAGAFTVEHGSAGAIQTTQLEGRASVFDGPTDVLYLSVASSATVRGNGRIAVAEAPADEVLPSQYIARSSVPVELRGAGRSSRQVHNFGTPAALGAAKLIVCEVLTPAENWSSYPAHKHDEAVPGRESRLEEIYYFETAVSRAAASADGDHPEPFGIFVTSTSSAGEIETTALVHSGDVALVPFGYHGPAVAAPGYDLYYLNVMAGPDRERTWLITDDPAQSWVRTMWNEQEIDPRLPFNQEGNIPA